MTDLKDKVIIITGASGGMGREIAHRLDGEGAKLALFSRNAEELKTLAEETTVPTVKRAVDVRCESDVIEAFKLTSTLGKPYALLNLAGLTIPAHINEMSVADFETTIDTNLKGTFLFSKHFANAVDTESGGIIVNVSSMAAKRANAISPAYCAAKAGVNMLAAGMAIQFKEKNIRVTTLNPGGTDTPFWGQRKVARENLLLASDIADVVMFILTRDRRVAFSELSFESFYNDVNKIK